MASYRLTKNSVTLLGVASRMAAELSADAVLILLDGSTDWKKLRGSIENREIPVIVAVDREADAQGASEEGLLTLVLNKEKSPLLERLQHALLEAAADEMIKPNGELVAVYSGFHQGRLDSVSLLQLDERMRRLTTRDLQRLESSVPLKTIKAVVDLAVEIGREGREGKRVGSLFVVGDHRHVLDHCRDLGADPFRGYSTKFRNLFDPKVLEDVKEIAQMDGAFVITADGHIERSRQKLLDSAQVVIQLSQGLGTRHYAGAAISAVTKAVAVVVSQSTGTVRLYQNGQIVMRIEPMDKAVKWQEFAYDRPAAESES